MEALFKLYTGYVALFVEAAAVLVIAFGAIEALIGLTPDVIGRRTAGRRRDVWARFGMWLLLGLEFELAADIVHSSISPSWTAIGQLAAIAVIRTVRNYFLEADIEKLRKSEEVRLREAWRPRKYKSLRSAMNGPRRIASS
jgi:uncharacterized membrane protein